MNLDLNTSTKDVSTPQMEQVEQEKQEYKLLGTFRRTPGLKLFAYNSTKDELFEVEISNKEVVDFNNTDATCPEEATVDSRNEHFEALNMKNAQRRLDRYKEGKLPQLFNLKEPFTGTIDIYPNLE